MTPEQKEMRAAVRAFTEREIVPVAEEYDRRGESPLHICHKFYAEGWMSRFLPDESGDSRPFLVDGSIVTEELAYGCAGVASIIMLPIFFNRVALFHLSGEVRAEFRQRLAEKPFITSFAASEHEAGSDLLTIQTKARRNKRGYVINGRKAFSGNVRLASYVIVVARTGPEETKSTDAFSWFLVPMDKPGVVIREAWDTLGLRAMDLSPIDFEDVEIPESYRLGEEGQGLRMMAEHLNPSRTGIAAMAVGIARRARDEVLKYGRTRKLYGDKLYKLQDYRFHIVEMEKDIAAARALVWLSGLKHDQGLDHSKEASIAKLFTGQMVMRVTGAASMMMGSLGYTRAAIVEKLLRDARHVAIVEGPEPVQKEMIFAEMLRRGVY